jgi:hypothetical protein
MKHNFWKGLVIYVAAYVLMQFAAAIMLGPQIYALHEWPADALIVFIALYLVPVGYSLTQTFDDVRFEYAKDVADGFLLAFLGHYMDFWFTLILFIFISFVHRFIAGFVKAVNEKTY